MKGREEERATELQERNRMQEEDKEWNKTSSRKDKQGSERIGEKERKIKKWGKVEQ